jgi:ABC-type sugar transport system substrate-binding protein
MKKTMKVILPFVLALGLLVVLLGCAKKEAAGNGSGEKKYTIAYVSASLSNEVFANQVRAMEVYCREKGYTFLNKPEEYTQDRITSCENYISQGDVDVIICHIESPEAMLPTMELAQSRGIKWFAYDSEMEGADVNFSVKSNYDFGQSCAITAEPWIKATFSPDEPVYAASANYPATPFCVERDNGYRDYLKEKCPNVVWVAEGVGGNQPNGVTAGENFLQTGYYINLVLGINDGGVLGVYEAFKAAGHVGDKVGLFGLDATKDAIAAIREGGIYRGTVSTNLSGLAGTFIDLAVSAVTDGPQGSHYFDMIPITTENLEAMRGKY